MPVTASPFSPSKTYRSATPVVIGSQRPVLEGWLSMRVSGRSCFSLSAFACGFLFRAQPNSAVPSRRAPVAALIRLASAQAQRRSRAQPSAVAQFRPAFVRASFRLLPAQAQRRSASPVVRVARRFPNIHARFQPCRFHGLCFKVAPKNQWLFQPKGLTHRSTGR